MEEYGRGLWDEAGNGEVDFALCKTISVLSIFKILTAKITWRSTRLPQYTDIRRSRRVQTPLTPVPRGVEVPRYIVYLTVRTNAPYLMTRRLPLSRVHCLRKQIREDFGRLRFRPHFVSMIRNNS